jgi:biotin operon repressor
MKPQTKTVLNLLQKGSLSVEQAVKRFGITRTTLGARVSELRREGYAVYTNRTKRGTSYRLGNPSREMVALAYKAAGQRAFQ